MFPIPPKFASMLHAVSLVPPPMPNDPGEVQFKNVVRYTALFVLALMFVGCAAYWLWHMITLPNEPINNLVSTVVGAGVGYALTAIGVTSGVSMTQQTTQQATQQAINTVQSTATSPLPAPAPAQKGE